MTVQTEVAGDPAASEAVAHYAATTFGIDDVLPSKWHASMAKGTTKQGRYAERVAYDAMRERAIAAQGERLEGAERVISVQGIRLGETELERDAARREARRWRNRHGVLELDTGHITGFVALLCHFTRTRPDGEVETVSHKAKTVITFSVSHVAVELVLRRDGGGSAKVSSPEGSTTKRFTGDIPTEIEILALAVELIALLDIRDEAELDQVLTETDADLAGALGHLEDLSGLGDLMVGNLTGLTAETFEADFLARLGRRPRGFGGSHAGAMMRAHGLGDEPCC